MGHQPGEVLPEEADHEGQREEHAREDREPFHRGALPKVDLVLLYGDHRDVRFQDGGQEVALGGDLLVDEQQVVVHVTDVRLERGRRLAGLQPPGEHGEQRVYGPVEVGGLATQGVDPFGRGDRPGEHRGLDLLDVALEFTDDRRVAVDDLVEDRPQGGGAAGLE